MTSEALEEWRPINITGGDYDVSSLGRVRSNRRLISRKDGTSYFTKQMILKNSRTGNGYLRVGLGRKIGIKTVHSLVAAAFIGPRPKGYMVLHWDDNKENNAASNLRYGTMKLNGEDGRRNDRYERSQSHHACKFSNRVIAEIKSIKGSLSAKEVSDRYGISKRYVFQIWAGECRVRA